MTIPTSEEVREVLRQKVRDPEIGFNVVDLGLVYDVQVEPESKKAEITMTLTSPACPVGPQILSDAQRQVHLTYPELEEVNINLTWSPMWTPDMMSDEAKDELGIF